jgi:hypothetical protein
MRLLRTVDYVSPGTASSQKLLGRLEQIAREPFVRLTFRTGLLVALFVIIDRSLLLVSRLPATSYEGETITLEAISHLLTRPTAAIAGLVLIAFVIAIAVRRRTLRSRWSDFAYGNQLRILIAVVAFLLAWRSGTYEYNAYFDQFHLIDRILLPLVAILLIWRPVFVLPFLWILLPIMQQFNHPIGGYSWAEQILPVQILTLFSAVVLVSLIMGRQWSREFIFLSFCMLAAYFWVPGIGKLRLNWFLEDQVYLLLPATYANGWLGFLPTHTISSITQALAWVNIPMKIGTMIGEVGAIACLWSRASLRLFLLLWIGLHAGIVLMSGIFFWMWIILEAVVLLLFFRRDAPDLPIFTRAHFLLSILIIGGGAFLFNPEKLAWKDSPVSYTYLLEGVGTEGQTYRLPPRYFAPFEYQFTLSSFHYLTADPHLMIVWGATSSGRMADALAKSDGPEQVFEVEKALGTVSFDPRRAAVFDEFVRRIVAHHNRRPGGLHRGRSLAAPPQLLTFPLYGPFVDDRIERVNVYQVMSFFNDGEYQVIRKRLVREILLAPGESF